MQARRAARELALILFSQLEKEITKYSKKDFEDIMVKSVRILSNSICLASNSFSRMSKTTCMRNLNFFNLPTSSKSTNSTFITLHHVL